MSNHLDQRNKAYGRAVPHNIEGYYTNFYTAATILRVARPELDSIAAEFSASTHVNEFYQYLTTVETYLNNGDSATVRMTKPFVVVVEGLDGSGKSTLVERLAETLPNAVALSTPTGSMMNVRDVFDKRGGTVARAFYMVSNYVLQHEIRLQHAQQSDTIFVVDRWFSSTCAYSIGWKNTQGGPESIDALDERLFYWPKDLTPPEIMILLSISDAARRERVTSRGVLDNCNPWDERLSQDKLLAQRIYRAHQRTVGPLHLEELDASGTKNEIAKRACEVILEHSRRHFDPVDYFRTQPLEFFRWASSRLDLCDPNSGRRKLHAPWAFQLALQPNPGEYPSLRSVGIHTVDKCGILFFAWGHPGGARGGETSSASMACVIGDYPAEQQWRAEGFIILHNMDECRRLGQLPPDSLVAQISACSLAKHSETPSGRSLRPEGYSQEVSRLRDNPLPRDAQDQLIVACRFVPMRMELLIGGPSSPGGPHRYEWHRSGLSSTSNGWTSAKSILPFNLPLSSLGIPHSLLPVSIVLMGTHCSGKKTIGEQIATILGCKFEPELGDTLRDKKNLQADGHVVGDGSGYRDPSAWDDLVHEEECRRDQRNDASTRVVETWHVGNLAWALSRMDEENVANAKRRAVLMDRMQEAVRKEDRKRSSVLFVMLDISPETSVRRRREGNTSQRLPMMDEANECRRLHKALQIRSHAILHALDALDIPLLVLENDEDGDGQVENVLARILKFLHNFHWRRAT